MIIFGWKSKPKVIGGFKASCRGCKKKTIHGIVKVTDWFTLYFIPLIPFKNKVFVGCNACGYRLELRDEAKQEMLDRIKALETGN